MKAQYPFANLGIVKVENLLALKVDGHFNRIIYPYFSEEPVLPPEGARLGLWLLKQALPKYSLEDFRMLDLLRSKSVGTVEFPFVGNEGDLFLQKYQTVSAEWKKLRKEY